MPGDLAVRFPPAGGAAGGKSRISISPSRYVYTVAFWGGVPAGWGRWYLGLSTAAPPLPPLPGEEPALDEMKR